MSSPDSPHLGLSQKDGLPFQLSRLQATDITLGKLNTNKVEVMLDFDGTRYVKKSLTDAEFNHTGLIRYLSMHEMPAVGFQGTVRGRNMREQALYMRMIAKIGLGSVIPVYADDTTLVYPYIEGDTLRSKIESGDTAAILPSLRSVRQGHDLGFRHGDRHDMNIVVQPDGTITHIDFETTTFGKDAEVIELTHLMYSIAGYTADFEGTMPIFRQFVIQTQDRYDWKRVSALLQHYDTYLTEHPFGKTMKRLIPRLHSKLPHLIDVVTVTE